MSGVTERVSDDNWAGPEMGRGQEGAGANGEGAHMVLDL